MGTRLNNVQVHLGRHGMGKVWVNGREIQNMARVVEVRMESGRIPVVTIEALPENVELVFDEAEVVTTAKVPKFWRLSWRNGGKLGVWHNARPYLYRDEAEAWKCDCGRTWVLSRGGRGRKSVETSDEMPTDGDLCQALRAA